MDQANRDKLRFCALCPDPCRYLYPAGMLPKESNMCSAMAYLGHAVMEGFVNFTPEVDAKLADTKAAEACREACPYRIDTPALVTEVRREMAGK